MDEYDITPISAPEKSSYDAVILAVGHQQFKNMGVEAIRELGKSKHVLYDLKYILPSEQVDLRL